MVNFSDLRPFKQFCDFVILHALLAVSMPRILLVGTSRLRGVHHACTMCGDCGHVLNTRSLSACMYSLECEVQRNLDTRDMAYNVYQ